VPDRISRAEAAIGRLAGDAGVQVSGLQLRQLGTYVDLLATWNRTVRLTSLDVEGLAEEALSRIVLQPLLATEFFPTVPTRWVDLGSGGGSPAIPLKVMRPSTALSMVESRGRKVAFLREAVRVCGLVDADVLDCRIEHLPNVLSPGSVGLFTVRAVRIDHVLASCIQGLAAPGAIVLLFGQHEMPPLPGFSVADRVSDSGGLLKLVRTV